MGRGESSKNNANDLAGDHLWVPKKSTVTFSLISKTNAEDLTWNHYGLRGISSRSLNGAKLTAARR